MSGPGKQHLFTDLPNAVAEECVAVLAENRNIRIERIVSTGQSSPPGFWYDQDEHEWVVLLQGGAKLLFDGDAHSLQLDPGDHVLIPAHKRHRVAWTRPDVPTIWLAVFFRD